MKTDVRHLQSWRRTTQFAFFVLFLIAPALDWLRFDLHHTQLWLLGQPWSLGIDAFLHGHATASEAAVQMILRGFLPALLLVGVFLGVAYRFGRVYCGWLCPHFSAVEMLNGLLHKAIGRFSVWDKSVTPRENHVPRATWWIPFVLLSVGLGFVWAVTLLTYLLPPQEIWGGLWHASLTPNQTRFIGIGTLVFTLEFVFARHLFCRFGCAAGLFQSLAWMANDRAMVVSFSRQRARECQTCDAPRGSACDNACPMRLHPRNIKRMMFSCVQCARCLTACDTSQSSQQRSPTLNWTIGLEAVRETLRQRREEAR